MPQRRRRLVIAAVVLLLVLLDLRARADGPPERGALEQVAFSAALPAVQLAAGFGDLLRELGLPLGTASEGAAYADLRRERDELRGNLLELRDLRAENARLRQLLDMPIRRAHRTIVGRVLTHSSGDGLLTVQVDRGLDDGVRRGLPVVAPGGLVGQVISTQARRSEVLLLWDPSSIVAVAVLEEQEEEEGQRARLLGSLEGARGGGALRHVPRSERGRLGLGDELVTSGRDGIFPPGLPVGTVEDSYDPGTGLFLQIAVRTIVQPHTLEEVAVILDPGTGPVPWLVQEEE